MSRNETMKRVRRSRAALGGLIGLTLATAMIVSCSELTTVEAPDVVQPPQYRTAAGASALAGGAITAFHQLYDDRIMRVGALGDEIRATSSVGTEFSGWDRRTTIDPTVDDGTYATIHGARQRILTAIETMKAITPDSMARIGHLYVFLGHTSLWFGEIYCAGIPFSHRDADLRPVYGQPLTTTQMFDSALAAFDSALVYGVDSARIANMARMGRGRALLNLGRYADASAAVTTVATSFVQNVTYPGVTTGGQGFTNRFHSGQVGATNAFVTDVTIPNAEGTNGINWRSANDPRVTLIRRAPPTTPLFGGDTIYGYVPYQNPAAPIRLTSGIEARLIEAEAALQAGNAAQWLAIHNALRATVTWPAGQSAVLVDPGTAAGRVDLHFRERAFWLFLTGQRPADLRRMVRQYGRNAETVFPTGAWRDGLSYDGATNMGIPATEANNPKYVGCIDRNA